VTVARKLTLGGGATAQSETAANNPASATVALNQVPGFVRLDAFASYAGWRNVELQLNVNNLTNALYYEQYSGAQAVPVEGRMVLVTARMRL
jgi:catecholate siderophore receptor